MYTYYGRVRLCVKREERFGAYRLFSETNPSSPLNCVFFFVRSCVFVGCCATKESPINSNKLFTT